MDILNQYPELASFLDDGSVYDVTASEFRADDQRWLLVTQRGPEDGGQLLFRITEEGLKPEAIDTALDLNPASRGLELSRAPNPVYAPSSDEDQVTTAATMREQVNVFSTRTGPDGGNLACVWAVRHLVRKALNRWITRTDSTSTFATELENGFRRTFTEAEVPASGIIISPTIWGLGSMRGRHGHVGLLGPREPGVDRLIYSNSSVRARWEQNFTLSAWKQRYEVTKGLRVLFFPLPMLAPAGTRSPEAETFSRDFRVPLSGDAADDGLQPDPLAGEGIPERSLVLNRDATRADAGLPIDHAKTLKVARFMKANFGPAMKNAVAGTPFSVDLLCGIACKETAIFWGGLIDTLPLSKIIERCVFDASGDFPGAPRNAFPPNTAAFRERYGNAFTAMLIDEANQTRALRNYGPKQWVYKGYGIFQYDLQHVVTDEAFFREKQWYSFDTCLTKAVDELKKKYAATGDLWRAVRAYNGSGPRATQYANHVMQFAEWCATVPMP
jgi:hypothetical protein